MAGRLTEIFPRPRQVTLGGRTYTVGEMTVGDLADLQDFLDRKWEDPLTPLRNRLDAMEEAERKKALVAAWKLAEAGPPSWGDERARALFDAGEGIVQILRVALRRHQPGIDTQVIKGPDGTPVKGPDGGEIAVVEVIAGRMSPDEYFALQRAFWGIDPADEIERLLGVDPGDRGRSIGWPQAVCETCEAYHWPLAHVESLTLSQFRAVRSGGRPRVRGTAVRPKTNLKERLRAARLKVYGEKGAGDGG